MNKRRALQFRNLNLTYGTQHDWHFHTNSLNGHTDSYESCRVCGIVKSKYGNGPCRGPVKVTLR